MLFVFVVILAVLELTREFKSAIVGTNVARMEVIEFVFEAILFVFVVILEVAASTRFVKFAIADVLEVILVVAEEMRVSRFVILFVLAEIKAGKVPIVVELTPPTLLTVGAFAVPPKSFVNLIFPLIREVASGVAAVISSSVATVPELGSVKSVAPVVVNDIVLDPMVVSEPPKVIVLLPLFTPVPP